MSLRYIVARENMIWRQQKVRSPELHKAFKT